MIQELGMLNH